MIEIEKPRIEALDLATNGTYGKFVVEPWSADTAPLSVTACAGYCFLRFPVWR